MALIHCTLLKGSCVQCYYCTCKHWYYNHQTGKKLFFSTFTILRLFPYLSTKPAISLDGYVDPAELSEFDETLRCFECSCGCFRLWFSMSTKNGGSSFSAKSFCG